MVVGGGIVGLACARALALRHSGPGSRKGLRICVLEKESQVATHQSARNSGVIHAGIYYAPGSQRALLCAEGARSMYAYCAEKDLPVKKVGKLIVATDESELPGLQKLYERGQANGVADLSMVSGSTVSELEPAVVGAAGLLSPHTGVACFPLVARSYARELQQRGGEIRTNFELVRAVQIDSSQHGSGGAMMELHSSQGATVRARHVLVCGGLYADRLAARVFGGSVLPRVVPVRGTWLQLRPEKRHLVQRNIYPVPDARFPFLGVHLTPTLHPEDGQVDGIIVGPNASLATAREGYDWTVVRLEDVKEMMASPGLRALVAKHLRFGMEQIAQELFPRWAAMKHVRRYVPSLRWEDILTARPHPWLMPWLERPVLRSGVRAQALTEAGALQEDFVFEAQMRLGRANSPEEDRALIATAGIGAPQSAAAASILHVRNAPSPAATSSLVIGERVADQAERVFQI